MRSFAILLYEDESWAKADLFERVPKQFPTGRATLLLGADGLSVKSKKGSAFASYAEVIDAEVSSPVAMITIRFAKRADLAFIPDTKAAAAEANSIVSEVRNHIAGFHEAASRASRVEPLVSLGTTARERLAGFRALLSGNDGPYRNATRTRAELWILATSSATHERERLGAIVALRFDASTEETGRLVSIGSDLANEVTARRVRIAVEGDDIALEELFSDSPEIDPEVESTLAGRLRRRRRGGAI